MSRPCESATAKLWYDACAKGVYEYSMWMLTLPERTQAELGKLVYALECIQAHQLELGNTDRAAKLILYVPALEASVCVPFRLFCTVCQGAEDLVVCSVCHSSVWCSSCERAHSRSRVHDGLQCAALGQMRAMIWPLLHSGYRHCMGCNSSAQPGHVCGRCRMVRYCSTACQSADWTRVHRVECKRLCEQHKTT